MVSIIATKFSFAESPSKVKHTPDTTVNLSSIISKESGTWQNKFKGHSIPNSHTTHTVLAALKAQTSAAQGNNRFNSNKCELYNHADMIVLGKGYLFFESTGNACNVETFSTELRITQNIPIVDAALTYD